jgi:hypothetical protein
LGTTSNAAASFATALGAGAHANFANSTALGTGATTTRANQVAIGTATNTYTLAGITSAASRAAQSGPTQFVTSDATGNLATTTDVATGSSVAALDGRVGALDQSVAQLQQNVAQLQTDIKKSYEGTAVAIALSAPALPDNKRYALSANIGTFRGETAFGGVFQYRVTDNIVLNGGVGTGFQYGGVGGRGGATIAW